MPDTTMPAAEARPPDPEKGASRAPWQGPARKKELNYAGKGNRRSAARQPHVVTAAQRRCPICGERGRCVFGLSAAWCWYVGSATTDAAGCWLHLLTRSAA